MREHARPRVGRGPVHAPACLGGGIREMKKHKNKHVRARDGKSEMENAHETKQIVTHKSNPSEVHRVLGRVQSRSAFVPDERLPVVRVPNGPKSASQKAAGIKTPNGRGT